MKIKSDFVTNSSSSCYVVFVPTNFFYTEKDFMEAIKHEQVYWDEYPNENEFDKLRQETTDFIESLKAGEYLYREYHDYDYRVYSMAEHIISQNNFGVTSVELSSDGMDSIVGIKQEKIMEILTNSVDFSQIIKIKESDEDENKQ